MTGTISEARVLFMTGLDLVGVGPGRSAIDLQVVTMRDETAAFAATSCGVGRPCDPKSGIRNPGLVS